MVALAALFAAAIVIAYLLGSPARRQARARRDEAILRAGFDAGVAAASPTPAAPSPRREALARVMAHKAAIPDLDRRAAYWRTPPVALADDGQIAAAIAAAGDTVRIVFTGWTDAEKAALIHMARGVGLRVMTNGSPRLALLCAGEAPGPVKLRQAAEVGAAIISGAQFERITAFDPAFPLAKTQPPAS